MLSVQIGPQKIIGLVLVNLSANKPIYTHSYCSLIVTLAAAFHGGFKNADQWNNNATLGSAISLAMDYWFSNDLTNIHCLDAGGTDACRKIIITSNISMISEKMLFIACGTPGFWNTNWFSNVSAHLILYHFNE